MPLELEPEPIVDPVTGEYLGDRYIKAPPPTSVAEDFANTRQYREAQAQRAADRNSGRGAVAQSGQQYTRLDPNAFNVNAWQKMWEDAQAARGTGEVLQDSQFAGQNQLWADELRRRAMGEGGPSAAERQLRAGLDTGARQALSLARSQRGVSPGMALRQAQQAQGQLAAQTQQQTSIMRAQEQQAAGQAYQQALQAGMNNEQAMNQARLAQQQIQDAWAQFGMQGSQAEARYNQLAQLEIEAMNRGDQRAAAQIALERERIRNQMDLAAQQRSDALLGGLFGLGGQVTTAALLGGG